MKKRYIGFAVWLGFSCLLYFFENNTGTRIVLVSSLLMPFFPVLRHGFFGHADTIRQPGAFSRALRAFVRQEENDPGAIRAYLPGDPVNRIHWKLTAKMDELLVREPAKEETTEKKKEKAVSETEMPPAGNIRKRVILIGLSIVLLSLILLFAVPSAQQSMKALFNRLFDASEAVNAYSYTRFDVPDNQPAGLGGALLAVIMLCLLSMAFFSGSRWQVLGLMGGCVLFQVYFGLSFPAWVNGPLFLILALRLIRHPLKRQTILFVFVLVTAVSAAVLLIYPGVDAVTEEVSETVRDKLSQMAQSITGTARELPAGENETRHMHSQSLAPGDQEARTYREFRLVTVEEEQISKPHWMNYLRIFLLLLLTIALVVLPFLPFILLNRRRKKALEDRMIFQSENVSEAVSAIFQYVTAWLEATGNGGGNVPYAAWKADLSPDYVLRFAACEKLFEEAAYSTHKMNEEHRRQVLELLNETERILQRKAGWKQRLRLKYKEFLWI